MQHLAADIRGFIAREEYIARSDLVGLSGAMHRHARAMPGETLRLERGGNERRPDRARRHRIDADYIFGQGLAQRTRESDDRAFGGRVVEQRIVPLISGDRGGVDDAGALLHVRQRVLHYVKEAEDIGAKRSLDLRGLDLTNILGLVLLGRVVYQNVDTPEFIERLVHS